LQRLLSGRSTFAKTSLTAALSASQRHQVVTREETSWHWSCIRHVCAPLPDVWIKSFHTAFTSIQQSWDESTLILFSSVLLTSFQHTEQYNYNSLGGIPTDRRWEMQESAIYGISVKSYDSAANTQCRNMYCPPAVCILRLRCAYLPFAVASKRHPNSRLFVQPSRYFVRPFCTDASLPLIGEHAGLSDEGHFSLFYFYPRANALYLPAFPQLVRRLQSIQIRRLQSIQIRRLQSIQIRRLQSIHIRRLQSIQNEDYRASKYEDYGASESEPAPNRQKY
jgi:hypothetical protein